MKLNKDFKMNVVNGDSMLYNMSAAADMSSVCILNEPAAWLWTRIGDAEFDIALLVEWLCEEYEVDKETADADVRELIKVWEEYGIVL